MHESNRPKVNLLSRRFPATFRFHGDLLRERKLKVTKTGMIGKGTTKSVEVTTPEGMAHYDWICSNIVCTDNDFKVILLRDISARTLQTWILAHIELILKFDNG